MAGNLLFISFLQKYQTYQKFGFAGAPLGSLRNVYWELSLSVCRNVPDTNRLSPSQLIFQERRHLLEPVVEDIQERSSIRVLVCL